MDFFYSPRSFHIAFILPINYKLYVFKWRLLSKVQVFVQKPKFVHLPLGFFGSLATTSIIPINVLSCLNKSANNIVVLQEFHSKYHIVSIVLLNPGSQVLQVFVLSDASTIE